MTSRLAVAVSLALVLIGVRPSAIFVRQDTKQVPVDRLVANLERAVTENPKDAQLHINLARLHAMAYARKDDELPASVPPGAKAEQPYYSPGSSPVANAVRPAPSPEHAAKAAQHLKSAIQHYDEAIAIAPDNMTAHLGRGWVREQAGDTKRAIEDYRRTIALAWPNEQKIKALMPSQRFITGEAIGYLLPLLDQKRDAAEIQDLLAKQQDMASRPRAITPIAIPLEDGLTPSGFVDPMARVRFDADGSALDREWTWITPRAGWLVYDAYGRGQIASALQLFGNVTFWLFWKNGYDALRGLDDDGNGELANTELRNLAIWRDANANGRSEDGEVTPLATYGIRALSCEYFEGDGDRIAAYSPDGMRLSNGRTRATYDVILQHSTSKLTRR